MEYLIGDRTFVVKKLVFRQWLMLVKRFKGIQLSEIGSVFDLLSNSECLESLFAIILVEKGKSHLKTDEEVSEVGRYIGDNIDISQALDIVNDFLALIPVSEIAEKVKSMSKSLNLEKIMSSS